MPHIFAQLPFPKASLAVLEAFSTIANIEIDLTELSEQAKEVEHKLGELLEKVKEALEDQQRPGGGRDEESRPSSSPPRSRKAPATTTATSSSELFRQARKNRTKAYELKRKLDRLELYRDYEDRFLDLFKKPG